jgi:hypothetical protein
MKTLLAAAMFDFCALPAAAAKLSPEDGPRFEEGRLVRGKVDACAQAHEYLRCF